jgi:hypothetical protein
MTDEAMPTPTDARVLCKTACKGVSAIAPTHVPTLQKANNRIPKGSSKEAMGDGTADAMAVAE